jgi:3-hydroxyacyl-[acyl-carrier-protein] dehydratase
VSPGSRAAAGNLELRFADDHPTAAGHFPGNPIIPGALLLDAALHAIAADALCQIRSVKFRQPVRPGDLIRLEWHEERGLTQFKCVVSASGIIAMSGTLRIHDRVE